MISFTIYLVVLYVVIPVSIGLLMMIIHCCKVEHTYLTPERILKKVFPYIKKSGNHNVIFGFIISKLSIKILYFYMMIVISIILLDISASMVTFAHRYNPYDGLECFGIDSNNLRRRVNSQSEADGVESLVCMGWNTDIGEAVGHAAGVLTLSWILASIVLWAKLNLSYIIITKLKNKKEIKRAGITCLIIVPQIVMGILTTAATLGSAFYGGLNKNSFITFHRNIDIMLICTILNLGITISWNIKKQKTIKDCCKEVVEKKQEEPGDLVQIKNRLRRRVQGHEIQVDRLLELAELECKKVLGDIYYVNEEEQEADTVSKEEMMTIAKVAYRNISENSQRSQPIEPTERDRLLPDAQL